MANTKLYRKGLRAAAILLRKYIVRNQVKLEQTLTAPGVTLLIAVLDAVTDLITYLETAFPADYTPV